MVEKEMATDRPTQNPSVADYAKESLAYLQETRDVLATIHGNITSNRAGNEEEVQVTCLLDNMAEIKETAMQIREIARNINMALFNE